MRTTLGPLSIGIICVAFTIACGGETSIARIDGPLTGGGSGGSSGTAGTAGSAGAQGPGGANGVAGSAGGSAGVGVASEGGRGGADASSGAGGSGAGGSGGAGAGSGAGGTAAGESGAGGAEAGSAGNSSAGAEAGSAGQAGQGMAGAGATVGTGAAAGAGACPDGDAPSPTIVRACRPATDNECDGLATVPGMAPEGANGNGFDDDCDGLVDEGCACPGAGTTKDCLLLPSSQTTGAPDYQPAGWCANNSRGKVNCHVVGEGEFKQLQWGGECVGAQAPAAVDVCQSGDFNCDGVDRNPNGCNCTTPVEPVLCPDPIYTTPFPDPQGVGRFSASQGASGTIEGIDGRSWINAAAMDPSLAVDWRWTVTGGPCDDILPNPTFAIFPTTVATWTGPEGHLGKKTAGLPLIPDPGQPDPTVGQGTSIQGKKGWVLDDVATPSKVFPAFSLSGDYYVTGKFRYPDPNNPSQLVEGQCTQVVKVRAPGLRVELCWPEVGPEQGDHDVDLHVARLQGNPSGEGKHGWFTTAGNAPHADDCYYSPNSACGNRFNPNGVTPFTPQWYANEVTDEPGGVGVCHGWGSRRFDGSLPNTVARPCTSPRLDRDNITCNPAIEDPNASDADGPEPEKGYTGQQGKNSNTFCGPENINLDAQVLTAGQRFAIGVQCYDCVQGKNGEPDAKPAHPRVNIYCNGELKLGFGYDPSRPAGQPQYPALITEGQTYHGSFWNVATVTWNGDTSDPCSIESGGAVQAGPEWDDNAWRARSNGSEFLCVQNGPLDSGGASEAPTSPLIISWPFTADGSYPDPAIASSLCAY